MENDYIENERALAAAVESGEAVRVAALLRSLPREQVEFTGRCYALAICRGDAEAALLLGTWGAQLDCTREPVVAALLASGNAGLRGLREFLQRYSYCRARRTYYLDVVNAPKSLGPIAALLEAGVGLSTRDMSELLSLSVRNDRVDMARVLVANGALLLEDIRSGAACDLAVRPADKHVGNERRWAELVSPRMSTEMLQLALTQCADVHVRVQASWFGEHTQGQMAAFLGSVVFHSDGVHCACVAQVLECLAVAGSLRALKHACGYGNVTAEMLGQAAEAARAANRLEAAVVLAQQARRHYANYDPLAL